MVDVAVVGAAGYAGIEVVRWVLGHPELRLACATSGADAGRRLDELYPALAGATDAVFVEPDVGSIAGSAHVALLAVPHTAAMAMVPGLLEAGVTVIDLSADFRLSDVGVYQHWYDTEHTAAGLLGEAVYGLPELDRSRLAGARLVAVPGCYPTATTLAAMPALAAGIATGSRVIVDAKSGVSGAGRGATAATHFCQVDESVVAYKVAAHRHTPEMAQSLSSAAGRPIDVLFSPHLVPMIRGLLSTVYLDVAPGTSEEQVREAYESAYGNEAFVSVKGAGLWPSTAEVAGTNRASVGLTLDESTSTLVVSCAIDNLGKGAAGQAIQCLNAVFGWPEDTGLSGVGPVL